MTEKKRVTYLGAEFDIALAEDAPAYFLFGIRKSGSSIANAMITALANYSNVNFVDVAGQLFAKGVSVPAWQNDAGLGELLHGGNLYGGFRNAPLGILQHPRLQSGPKVLLVRDPRDALVSEYFSNAYSHSIPAEGETREMMLQIRSQALNASVRDYVLTKAPLFARTMREYQGFLSMPGMRVYRYEDAIMNKGWFLRGVCEHFGWTVSDAQIGQILNWADVMPDEERPTEFVRRVKPGDHRDKLDEATIAKLDEMLADELAWFGYKN
ncbi:sulfotransferase domain-containing protein [Roseomonas populi]|uniref:Sulfotransferase domain-containing protein n=1 Tax=Roseomonas populi TaxID=3121582 RepID=A0ABT1X7J7_9PROT|nr:sulfotransferase domain-containing protein [Roseomonas pecuniae]MCR0983679.1 sulfotransferase domain-containing protein [Roseomonas pecuniae]